jgi:hypothetical protein
MAVDFDGVNDYIDCGSGATIDDIFDGGGTITLWVNADADPADGGAAELVSQGNAGYNQGYVFRIFNDAGATSYDRSVMLRVVWSGGTGDWRVNESQTPANGAWYHLAVAYDADSATNDPLVYINGVSQTVGEISAGSGTRVSGAANTVAIGSLLGTNPFDGKAEDVRMFTRILTAEEVAALAAGYRGPLGGEVLWLSCNDFATMAHPDGTTLTTSHVMYDMSGNGNDGVPTNGPVARASEAPRYFSWRGFLEAVTDVVYTNITPAAVSAVAASIFGRLEKELRPTAAWAVAVALFAGVWRLRSAIAPYRVRHQIAPERPVDGVAPARDRHEISEGD